jgi:hypothetical protein
MRGVHPESHATNLHHPDPRKLYLNDYAEQEHKSLLKHAETDDAYVSGLKWPSQFLGFVNKSDKLQRQSTSTWIESTRSERREKNRARPIEQPDSPAVWGPAKRSGKGCQILPRLTGLPCELL